MYIYIYRYKMIHIYIIYIYSCMYTYNPQEEAVGKTRPGQEFLAMTLKEIF